MLFQRGGCYWLLVTRFQCEGCEAEPAAVDDGWSLGFGGEGGAGEPVAKMKLPWAWLLSSFAFLPRFLDGVFCD